MRVGMWPQNGHKALNSFLITAEGGHASDGKRTLYYGFLHRGGFAAPALRPRAACDYREARRAGSYVGAVRGGEGMKSQAVVYAQASAETP